MPKIAMTKSYTDEEKVLLREIGDRIRELRLKSGLSQEKLAFASGLDRSYVGSVERGERNIAVINLSKIATALNVTSSDILKIES